jgi:hypothetical protein
MMDAATQVVFIQLPLLVVVGAAAASLVWWYHEGALGRHLEGRLSSGLKMLCLVALAAAWVVLTVVSWWCLFLGVYLTTFAMYVLFGSIGGWVALIGAALLLASVPLVWGVVLFGLARREFRYASTTQSVRALPPVRALPG